MTNAGSSDSGDTTEGQERARLVVGLLGLALLLGFMALSIAVDEGRGQQPARVRVKSISVDESQGTKLATVEVENVGDVTAERVLVRIEVKDDGEDPVERDIDFLAPGESDDLTVVLPDDATEDDVEATVPGWAEAR